jgi:hypothetical protein
MFRCLLWAIAAVAAPLRPLRRHLVESDFESSRQFPDFASGFFAWTQGPQTARRRRLEGVRDHYLDEAEESVFDVESCRTRIGRARTQA